MFDPATTHDTGAPAAGTPGPFTCSGPDTDPDEGTEHPPCGAATVWTVDKDNWPLLVCTASCGFYRHGN